jgi:cyclohexa-1,5-dienecarbonyl-CoA hydratase
MVECKRKDRTAQLILNNPPVNVLTADLLDGLTERLEDLAGDDGLTAVFLMGNGKYFSAGASVEEHSRDQAPRMIEALTRACQSLSHMPVPVVALVHGLCLGGAMELVSFCDFVVADPGARFGVPEILLAFFPPYACQVFPTLMGRQNAAHLIFSGKTIDAQQAHQFGLVQEITPRQDWSRWAKHFNGLSRPVVRLAKRAFREGAGEFPEEQIERLTRLFLQDLYELEDVEEGIRSFVEKRPPQWKHC